MAGAGALKGLVFLMILMTVVVQGFTAPWLARRLDLVEPVTTPGGDATAVDPLASLAEAEGVSRA